MFVLKFTVAPNPRGVIPAELELLFEGLDDDALVESVQAFARDPDATVSDAEVERIAQGVVDRMAARIGVTVGHP